MKTMIQFECPHCGAEEEWHLDADEVKAGKIDDTCEECGERIQMMVSIEVKPG